MINIFIGKSSRIVKWKPLVLLRKISCENDKPLKPFRAFSSENDKPLNPLSISRGESDEPPNPFRKVIRRRSKIVDPDELKIANRICLSVIGNGAVGQPSTLCMFTEYRSYMFNCGEGVGRVFREQNLKISDVHHVFITHRKLQNMSGFPEFCNAPSAALCSIYATCAPQLLDIDLYLTLQMLNRKKLTMHGPPKIEEIFGLTASYNKHVRISKKPVENKVYKDETLEIIYVPILRCAPVTSQLKNTMWSSGSGHQNKGMKPAVSSVPEDSDVAVSYICKCLPKPRELALEKCVELGVPLGPLLVELKNGSDVTLPSGRKILSEEVLVPESPSLVFLVVDCPSDHFLNSFVQEEKFKPYQMPSCDGPNVSAVVHFTPPDVFHAYAYQKWINRFPSNTLHLVLNSSNLIPYRSAVHQMQNMLHLIHPRIFKSLPKHNNESEDPVHGKNIIQAEGGLMLHLRPSVYLDRNNVVVLEPEVDVKRAKAIPGFCEHLSHLHCRLPQDNTIGDEYPEIIFLGTNSSYASAYRGCSSILINVSPKQSIMFDCGDGTHHQLIQYFGQSETNAILKKISCVFISHHHVDHYTGLFQLIKARKEAFYMSKQKYVPLALTAPRLLYKIFDNFENLFDPIKHEIRIFRNSSFNVGFDEGKNNLKKFLKDFKCSDIVPETMYSFEICHINQFCRVFKKFQEYVAMYGKKLASFFFAFIIVPNAANDYFSKLFTVPVQHCYDSHGVILTDGSTWKIVYSGDCAPSQSLIDAGKDCTLLIHEGTVEDELVQEATFLSHSTISQAIDVAHQMNAQHTIITHFSNRYVEVPSIKDCYQNYSVGIAFDNMRVRLSDLHYLPLFIPTLRCLFSERLDLHHVQANDNAMFEAVTLRVLKS